MSAGTAPRTRRVRRLARPRLSKSRVGERSRFDALRREQGFGDAHGLLTRQRLQECDDLLDRNGIEGLPQLVFPDLAPRAVLVAEASLGPLSGALALSYLGIWLGVVATDRLIASR